MMSLPKTNTPRTILDPSLMRGPSHRWWQRWKWNVAWCVIDDEHC